MDSDVSDGRVADSRKPLQGESDVLIAADPKVGRPAEQAVGDRRRVSAPQLSIATRAAYPFPRTTIFAFAARGATRKRRRLS